jgi:hypothetical protein
MQESPIQILEVRAGDGDRPVTVTAAVSGDACRAILTALSEQLDRRRGEPLATVEDVMALREHTALVERFAPLAAADGHAIVAFSELELRTCLLSGAHRRDHPGSLGRKRRRRRGGRRRDARAHRVLAPTPAPAHRRAADASP